MLAGCAAALGMSVVALVAVAGRVAVFVGGLTARVLGGAAAWLAAGGFVDGAGAAASAAGVPRRSWQHEPHGQRHTQKSHRGMVVRGSRK